MNIIITGNADPPLFDTQKMVIILKALHRKVFLVEKIFLIKNNSSQM